MPGLRTPPPWGTHPSNASELGVSGKDGHILGHSFFEGHGAGPGWGDAKPYLPPLKMHCGGAGPPAAIEKDAGAGQGP